MRDSPPRVDHAKSVDELSKLGLRVYKPYELKEQVAVFGDFRVQTMTVPHGECECHAFYIKVAGRKILYATDFEYFPYRMEKIGLTDIIVECNYQTKYLDMDADNIMHKVTGHCELETCKDFVSTNATDALSTVILTHLGVGTCDGNECVSEIKKVVNEGVTVDYARAGETYILDKEN